MSSEGARKLRQEIFGDVSFVPIHLKDSGIAQSMADIVEFEVESRIDAAVAPLVDRLDNTATALRDLIHGKIDKGDALLAYEAALKALEQWRTGR